MEKFRRREVYVWYNWEARSIRICNWVRIQNYAQRYPIIEECVWRKLLLLTFWFSLKFHTEEHHFIISESMYHVSFRGKHEWSVFLSEWIVPANSSRYYGHASSLTHAIHFSLMSSMTMEWDRSLRRISSFWNYEWNLFDPDWLFWIIFHTAWGTRAVSRGII